MQPLPEPSPVQGFVLSPDLMSEIAPNIGTALAFGGELLTPDTRATLERIHAGLWAEFMRVDRTRPQILTDFEHGALVLAMCIVAGFTHIPVDGPTYAHRLRRSAAHCLTELTGPHSAEDLAAWGREERAYAERLLSKYQEKGEA
ncbi:hypothetical protein DEIPH_ctg017orf0223 [Deinococcus phoenicis]|uniref:Uncharacterized protein n=1 Tax=Deinococcus phoenicis TaxID=1476583 RepID=A0A016QRS1_9DEIO|nr:hypothetical protein [Deinococcus phoenicis]EYB68845.1 hypothetical protein DEIPH_ctg017orf0223 [Deinococcus phoenicis]